MKTVKFNDNIRRVDDAYAARLVNEQGWKYCPKHELKSDPEVQKRKKGKNEKYY